MSFNVGESVGPYRIIEQLGQGGMATVYKAYHASLDRYVALKVLHPAFNEDQTFLRRFQREARLVAKLEHSSIVPVYDYAEHDHRPFLVMKFIEGETLKSRLGREPLSAHEIQNVVEAVGSALAYAHRQGILHRDIKPSNVLMATAGEIYLADFGLARIAQAEESTLSSDSIMGTPQYISPEQAMGTKELDERTDIYSFGVMLYEMVVGQVPFTADTPFSVIHDHIYTPLPLPRNVNPSVPEPVQRALLKALAKNRLDRYQTVQELVVAFKNAWREAGVPMEGSSVMVAPPTLKGAAINAAGMKKATQAAASDATQPVQIGQRSPWFYAAGGTIFFLCCLLVGFAFRQGGFFPSKDTMTITPFLPTEAVGIQTPMTPPAPEVQSTQVSSAVNVPPAVAAAIDLVSKKPSDPDAHLQLALALWDAGQLRAAVEELAQAATIAGASNRNFLLKAVDQFKGREAWVASASMYLRLIQTYPVNEMPPELFESFHEAVYKASEKQDMPLFLFFERIDRIDQPMGFIARGRYALYNGTIADARLNLEQVKEIKPDSDEAFLLEAEIDAKEGHPELARPILISLSSGPGTPEWIRKMAEDLIKTMS